MERLPRAFLFILGDYHGIFPRVTHCPHVLQALADAAYVFNEQPHGAPDSGIGDVTGTHHPRSAIDMQLVAYWAVYHIAWCPGTGADGLATEISRFIHTLYPGYQQRHVGG